jgi:hypothetical protein
VPWSLHCATAKGAVAPVGMTKRRKARRAPIARRKESGRFGPFGFAQGRRDDKHKNRKKPEACLGFATPSGLRRCYGKAELHFITFSCYRCLPLLKTVGARELFVQEFGRVREEKGFRLVTKGVPPAIVSRPGR